MKYSRFVWLLLVLAMACKSKPKGSFEVNGTVKNFDELARLFPNSVTDGKMRLLLFEIPFGNEGQPIQLDSVTITAKETSFTLNALTHGQGMYDVLIDKGGPMIPLVNDVPELTLSIDASNKTDFYKVTGSPATSSLQTFINEYNKNYQSLDHAFQQIDSLKKMSAVDSLVIEATNKKNRQLEEMNTFLRKFLKEVEHPSVASFALGQSFQTLPEAEFEKELFRLAAQFQSDASLAKLKTQYETFKAQSAASEKRQKENSWVGKTVPAFSLPDANGKSISLASFKGKYVLVDFWASWCGPCRKENPNVVAAYNQFKDKNFTILGVSLDEDRSKWLEAIKADGLNWTHISDLAYWKSAAVTTFKFEGIPFNILVDPNGTVIAEGLRGDDLTKKLAEVLK